jgi:hypothetical protein
VTRAAAAVTSGFGAPWPTTLLEKKNVTEWL